MKKSVNEKVNPFFCSLFDGLIMRPTLSLFYKTRVEGEENLPNSGPAVLVCKHQSWMDLFMIFDNIPRRMSYLAKYELFENIFGDYEGTTLSRIGSMIKFVSAPSLEMLGAMPLDRDHPERYLSTFKRIRKYLAQKEFLVFFPEGRTVPGEMGEFKCAFVNLLLKMQKKMKTNIHFIPVGLSYFPKKGKPTEILMKFNSPMVFEPGDENATDKLKEKVAEVTHFNKP